MDAERFETQVSIHTHFDAEARDKHPRTEGFHILVEDIWTTQARESDHQTSDWWMTEAQQQQQHSEAGGDTQTSEK